MISPPVMMRCQNGLTFSRFAPLLIVVSMNEPISGPWMMPTAPNRLVPPMTEAAIDCNSQPSPVVALPMLMRDGERMPANAASNADSDVGDIDACVDVHAGQPRRLRVAADGEQVAAPAAVVQEDVGGHGDQDDHPEQHRDREHVRPSRKARSSAREIGEGVGRPEMVAPLVISSPTPRSASASPAS